MVSQCIFNDTDVGIQVNSYDPLPAPELWCIEGISLINNTFVQVEEEYVINNECGDVVIFSYGM